MKSFKGSLTALALLLFAMNAEAAKSGPAVGDAPAPFEVTDITGPSAGKSLCYRCKYGSEPVVCLFIRDTSEMNVELIKALDEKLGENKKLRAFAVLLTDKPDQGKSDLAKVAKEAEVKNIPLTVFPSTKGPEDYKLVDDVKVTIVLWSDSKVKANVNFKNGLHCEGCVASVMAEIPKIAE
ncbi:hypothetical protein K2Y11_23075 [bacterium]|nr:hypothetical protein [bacterium]